MVPLTSDQDVHVRRKSTNQAPEFEDEKTAEVDPFGAEDVKDLTEEEGCGCETEEEGVGEPGDLSEVENEEGEDQSRARGAEGAGETKTHLTERVELGDDLRDC